MERKEIITYLESKGLNPDSKANKTNLMISRKIIRCINGDTLIAAVGRDADKDVQLHSVVDAVHWHLQTKDESGKLRLVLGRRHNAREMDELLNGVALMLNKLQIPLQVQVEVDFEPHPLKAKGFNKLDTKWISFFENREESKPPQLAMKLSGLVDDASFRWYRNVTGNYWSGRVEGLEVCRVSVNGKSGTLKVGKRGKKDDGEVRKIFLKLANGKEGNFTDSRLEEVAEVVKQLVNSRANGELRNFQREHLLESRILRNVVTLLVEGRELEPVFRTYPFQFPNLWAPQGRAHYLDALMHSGNVPWAVEIKEPKGSRVGQGYRHAITQAVLYREFIKRAKQLHAWFKSQSLDATECQAAVAFPKMDSNQKQQKLLCQHKKVANAFGVKIIEVDHGWDCAR